MIILKKTANTHFSILYFIDGEKITPIGHLAQESIELLKEKMKLFPVDHTQVIERHFKSEDLIKDVKSCQYFYLHENDKDYLTPFEYWLIELRGIAERLMPRDYKPGDKWHEPFWKQYFDKGVTPMEAWADYTKEVQ